MVKTKGQLVFDSLLPWIIGLVVLVLVISIYSILTEKGLGFLDFFKNTRRYG